MRKFGLAVFASLLMVGVALAQQPAPPPVVPVVPVNPAPPVVPVPAPVAISGDTSVPCYGFARLALTGVYTSAGWLCFPDRTTGAAVVSSYTTPNGHVYVFSGPSGAYDVGAFAQTPSGIVTLQTVVTILPAAPAPAPIPIPTPGPAPGPAPPLPAPNPTPTPTPPAPRPFPSTQFRRAPFPSTTVIRPEATRDA